MQVEPFSKRIKMPYYQLGLLCILGGLAIYAVIRTETFIAKVETLTETVDSSAVQLDRAVARMDQTNQALAEKAAQPVAVAVVPPAAPVAKEKSKPAAMHKEVHHESVKPAPVQKTVVAVHTEKPAPAKPAGLLDQVGLLFRSGNAPAMGPAPVTGTN